MSASRRAFVQYLAGSALAWHGQPRAAKSERFDLVVAGGNVIDPSQGLSMRADVGIRNGLIARIAGQIPPETARTIYDASGHIVCPGMVDLHAHVADSMMPVSIDPDLAGIPTGVTTFVDAGSTGARTLPAFRKYVVKRAETRIYALLNISSIGLVVLNELYLDPKMINVKRAIRTIRDNRDLVIGLKVRFRGGKLSLEHDLGIMKKVREVADETGLPIMTHWTNEPRLLAMLKPGDLMTHPFSPAYLGQNCINPNGKIYPQILELPDRGIGVDLGHGSSFDWNIAEKAAAQGWYPDALSTDMFTRYFGPKGVVGNMGSVMSKFLLLGLSIDQVIEKVTHGPAKLIPMPEQVGSLKPGAIADLAVLKIRNGKFTFTDSPKLLQQRVGERLVEAVATIKSGRLYKNLI